MVVRVDEDRDAGVLTALTNECRWSIVQALRGANLTQQQLADELKVTTATICEHLDYLTHGGVAIATPLPGRARHYIYCLTDGGGRIGPIAGTTATWQRLSALPDPPPQAPGAEAAKLVDREWVLPVVRLVAAGHERRTDIQELLGISERTLDYTLKSLRDAGAVILQRHGHPKWTGVQLTHIGRRMPMIPLVSCTWEWKHRHPVRPAIAADLAGMIRIASTLVQTPADVNGVCRLRMPHPAAIEPHVSVYVHDGHIEVLKRSEQGADAHAVAKPADWGFSVITGRLIDVHTSGDPLLPSVVVHGLSKALLRKG